LDYNRRIFIPIKKNAHYGDPRNVLIYFAVGVKYSDPETKDSGDTLLISLQKSSKAELAPYTSRTILSGRKALPSLTTTE
jgi:hypothetical protein